MGDWTARTWRVWGWGQGGTPQSGFLACSFSRDAGDTGRKSFRILDTGQKPDRQLFQISEVFVNLCG
jgi:hypothetical protein